MYMITINQIPREAFIDCTRPGQDATENVKYWRPKCDKIEWPDRETIIKCLSGYGGWDDEELANKDDDELEDIAFYLACGDFAEYQHAVDAGEFTQRDGYKETNCGADIFVFE